ncbi:MAG: metallopeptidase family protein [Chloroflexota bacterium]|nr:metallopeptidase family protein [Chloroflexota bacterium]
MSDRAARLRALRGQPRRYRPDLRTFEQLVAEALAELPAPFRDLLSNVAVEVAEWPSPDDAEILSGDEDDGLLGLYRGIPYGERGTGYHLAVPDRITIYRRPILDLCRTEEEVRAEIRKTVLHEVGHYFGLSDEELP